MKYKKPVSHEGANHAAPTLQTESFDRGHRVLTLQNFFLLLNSFNWPIFLFSLIFFDFIDSFYVLVLVSFR